MTYRELVQYMNAADVSIQNRKELERRSDELTMRMINEPMEFQDIMNGVDVDPMIIDPYLYALFFSRYSAYCDLRNYFNENQIILDRSGPVFIEPITRLSMRKFLILDYGEIGDTFLGSRQLSSLKLFGMGVRILPSHLSSAAHDAKAEGKPNGLSDEPMGITENVYISIDLEDTVGMSSGITFIGYPLGNIFNDYSRAFTNANTVIFNPGCSSINGNRPESIKSQKISQSLLSRPLWIIIKKHRYEVAVEFAKEVGARYRIVPRNWTLNRFVIRRRRAIEKCHSRYIFGDRSSKSEIIMRPRRVISERQLARQKSIEF